MRQIRYPELTDVNGNLIAILDRAYNIGYSTETNALWRCSFTMSYDDEKAALVQPKYHVRLYDYDRYIGRFIVNPTMTVRNETTREVTFECEHVLALLHNDILFRYHQLSGYTTEYVLDYLLSTQEVAHWTLGNVAFTRYFSYSWENEDSLLNAIFSVPKPFNVDYRWEWDDTVYPFVLNLVAPEDTVKDIVVAGKNLRGIEIERDPTNIVTRIYPLGNGEGVNQLTIAKVNGGQLYLSDATAEALYGVHKRVWVDNRFEDAESLKASAQAILDQYKRPQVSCQIDAIDYSLIDFYESDMWAEGDVLRIYDLDANTNEELRIYKLEKADIYGNPLDISVELGDKRRTSAMTIADLQKKQLVNEVYSQGATNIDSRDFADNCDATFPAVIRFPIPDDVVNINEMKLTFETTNYRAYSKAIAGGGGIATSTASGGGSTQTSTSGGGTTATSSSGGGTTESTTSGGGTTATSSSGGGTTQSTTSGGVHRHLMFDWIDQPGTASLPVNGYIAASNLGGEGAFRLVEIHSEAGDLYTAGASDAHSHSVTVPSHTHSVTIPNHSHSVTVPSHTHSVTIPNHSHNVSIPAHTHDINIPNHTHGIDYGIYEFETLPTAVQITVDGTVLPMTAISGDNIDLIPYLQKDSDGKISRGRYAEIKLAPNNLARINATVTSRLFIQSRIGTTA